MYRPAKELEWCSGESMWLPPPHPQSTFKGKRTILQCSSCSSLSSTYKYVLNLLQKNNVYSAIIVNNYVLVDKQIFFCISSIVGTSCFLLISGMCLFLWKHESTNEYYIDLKITKKLSTGKSPKNSSWPCEIPSHFYS